jgi:hypothetical protein
MLLLAVGAVVMVITYSYDNFTLTTDIANENLWGDIVFTVISITLVFGALAEFTLNQGQFPKRNRRTPVLTAPADDQH